MQEVLEVHHQEMVIPVVLQVQQYQIQAQQVAVEEVKEHHLTQVFLEVLEEAVEVLPTLINQEVQEYRVKVIQVVQVEPTLGELEDPLSVAEAVAAKAALEEMVHRVLLALAVLEVLTL